MIPDDVMDKIIKVPTEEEYMGDLIENLSEKGFIITNFSKGGVFYILLYVVVHGLIQLKKLAVDIVNSAFMKHCPEDWVEIRAADFSTSRKEGVRASGNVTVYRSEYNYPVKVRKGHPFTTMPGEDGSYLTYYASCDTVMPEGQEECLIPIEAETEGTTYNVAAGRICRTLVYIEGYDYITNGENWLKEAGTETEEIESLRQRCINRSAVNARMNPDRKIKSVVESISGVVTADIDSQAPRGEGTVDIIITGPEGTAGEALINKVEAAIAEMWGSYGNYLVKSAESVKQDFILTVYIDKGISTVGYEEQVAAAIQDLMKVSKRKDLHTLYRDEIIGKLISTINGYKKSDIISPASDVVAEKGKVIIAGEITVTVCNIT